MQLYLYEATYGSYCDEVRDHLQSQWLEYEPLNAGHRLLRLFMNMSILLSLSVTITYNRLTNR
jgi:hypothetical protein